MGSQTTVCSSPAWHLSLGAWRGALGSGLRNSAGARPRPTCGVTALGFLSTRRAECGGCAHTCSAGRSPDFRSSRPSSQGYTRSAGAAGAPEDLPHPILAAAQPDTESKLQGRGQVLLEDRTSPGSEHRLWSREAEAWTQRRKPGRGRRPGVGGDLESGVQRRSHENWGSRALAQLVPRALTWGGRSWEKAGVWEVDAKAEAKPKMDGNLSEKQGGCEQLSWGTVMRKLERQRRRETPRFKSEAMKG